MEPLIYTQHTHPLLERLVKLPLSQPRGEQSCLLMRLRRRLDDNNLRSFQRRAVCCVLYVVCALMVAIGGEM